jgi:arylsulfate sulfotransferase
MPRNLFCGFSMLCAFVLLAGCGGSSNSTSGGGTSVIAVAISPQTATVASGQSAQFTATVTGDSTGVNWSVNGTAGGSSTVGTVDSTGKYTAPTVTQKTTATVTATSKADATKSASAAVTITAAPVVAVAISPQTALVGASQVTQFTATVTGSTSGVTWSVNGMAGGSAAVGTIDSTGKYTAPAAAQNATATVTAASNADPTKSASGAITIIAAGVVTTTNNVQVASYTITTPASANVSIQFGPDTTYGLTTWQQASPAGGGAVSIYVAGMKLGSAYHMRAILTFADGSTFDDSDHIFTTGTLPAASLPNLTVTTTAGATPQSGVELVDLVGVGAPGVGAVVTDLAGNVLWTYNPPGNPGISPIKLLPNGHFLVGFSAQPPDGLNSFIQEVDLGGNVLWSLTAAQLNASLATATCAGCNITVVGTHHDFQLLPNGHIIVIASTQVTENVAGFTGPVTVTGDVLIDLDENHNPVWLWSAFDHLDIDRHPMGFPDWTHTNSVVYSPDDHALVISMRHQAWVLKIDYNDGQGTGNIIWHLGYQGDFALQNGTDPIDWFYGQHDANIISPNSTGVYKITVFDDGNQRVLDTSGTICGDTGTPPCTSRDPILQLDENAMTATLTFDYDGAPNYSIFGGSSRVLQNGNVEFDECGLTATGTNNLNNQSLVLEVTQTSTPQIVWQMQITGNYAYRSFRIPSLYPGVQW